MLHPPTSAMHSARLSSRGQIGCSRLPRPVGRGLGGGEGHPAKHIKNSSCYRTFHKDYSQITLKFTASKRWIVAFATLKQPWRVRCLPFQCRIELQAPWNVRE